MKKIITLSVIMLLVCGVVSVAQENAISRIEELRDALPIKFEAYGKAVWAPLIYRGYGNLDNLLQENDYGAGPAFGAGAGPSWDIVGAAVGIRVYGSDQAENIGFDLRLRAEPGTGGINIRGYDNTACLWARPFGEVLKMQLGVYQWDELRGKVGGIGEVVGGYGGDEDDIFRRVEASDAFSAMFIFTPPSMVPDGLKGLTLFAAFGVSGGIDTALSRADTFSARTEKALEHIFSTPHAGIAYQNDVFGLARLQFVGGTYLWGGGSDWTSRTVDYPWYGTSTPELYWLNRSSRVEPRLELAINLTAIPMVNMDLGFSIPFPVTVTADDTGSTEKTMLGPRWIDDLGYRGTMSGFNENRIAGEVGDVWRAPVKIALGLDFKPAELGFGLRFRTKLEFAEEVAFIDGSDNYKAGLKLQIGVQPEYTFDNIGTVSLNAALRFHQNDTFNGKRDFTYNNIAIASLYHNGAVDLGLGVFFTKPIGRQNYIKAGISMTLPVGGDRYNWSVNSIPGVGDGDMRYFSGEAAERYKQGNLIVAIPVILEMKL